MADATLGGDLERRLEELGYEMVDLEQAGSAHRPILRLRIDRPESGEGISHEDCRIVSRALEEYLDQRPGLSERYVLEVSSPGVERPLVRPRDFQRFVGQPVALHGAAALAGRARRLEGELLGIGGEGHQQTVRIRLAGGDEVEVPYAEITKAHLVFRWGKERRPS